MQTELNEGVKHDEEKTKFHLIPDYPLEELAKLYTEGAKKYEDWNWKKGMKWSRVFSALLRHLYAWRRGIRYDDETSREHLSAVMWACCTLMEYERLGLGEDDRPCKQDLTPEYVAGLFDSDGYITYKDVGVTQTRKEIIEALQQIWGGSIYERKMKKSLHKTAYEWHCPAENIIDLLTTIIPYLMLKRRQAELVCEYRTTIPTEGNHPAKAGTPEEIKQYREQIKEELSALNKRGT